MDNSVVSCGEQFQTLLGTVYFLNIFGLLHTVGLLCSLFAFICLSLLSKSRRLPTSPVFYLILLAILCGTTATVTSIVSRYQGLLLATHPNREAFEAIVRLRTASVVLHGLVPILTDSTGIFRLILFFPRVSRRISTKAWAIIALPVLLKTARVSMLIVSAVQLSHSLGSAIVLSSAQARVSRASVALNFLDEGYSTVAICYMLRRLGWKQIKKPRSRKHSRTALKMLHYLRVSFFTAVAVAIVPTALSLSILILLLTGRQSQALSLYLLPAYNWSVVLSACFSSFWPVIRSESRDKDVEPPIVVFGLDADLEWDLKGRPTATEQGNLTGDDGIRQESTRHLLKQQVLGGLPARRPTGQGSFAPGPNTTSESHQSFKSDTMGFEDDSISAWEFDLSTPEAAVDTVLSTKSLPTGRADQALASPLGSRGRYQTTSAVVRPSIDPPRVAPSLPAMTFSPIAEVEPLLGLPTTPPEAMLPRRNDRSATKEVERQLPANRVAVPSRTSSRVPVRRSMAVTQGSPGLASTSSNSSAYQKQSSGQASSSTASDPFPPSLNDRQAIPVGNMLPVQREEEDFDDKGDASKQSSHQ